MSEPIVFISKHKIKEGKLDALKKSYQEGAKFIEVNKPQTVAFLAYLDEDASEVGTIHVFPDAESMAHHMEGADDRAQGAAEYLEFDRFELYGKPDEATMQMLEQSAESGIKLSVRPEYISGYIRLDSG
jgi:hypothetical protein